MAQNEVNFTSELTVTPTTYIHIRAFRGFLVWTLHVCLDRRPVVLLSWDLFHHGCRGDGEDTMCVHTHFDFHFRLFSIFLCRNILNDKTA